MEVRAGRQSREFQVLTSLPAGTEEDIRNRLARLLDLSAPTTSIADHLGEDEVLRASLRRLPGIRVPGSWDPFETSVRAIIGQVVSLQVATKLTGRLAAKYGEHLGTGDQLLGLVFPTPERLAQADLAGIGLSGQKVASIRALAQAVATGSLQFEALVDLDDALAQLQRLPGIGPWTAHYIAMRALGHADAFPAGDLILRRAAARDGRTMSEKELESLSKRWRPYRAYAAMLLWASYAHQMTGKSRAGGEKR